MPSLYIHHHGKTYDISSFLSSHPGGADCIIALVGKDVTEAMSEAGGHEHSAAAWEMMEEFRTFIDPGEHSCVLSILGRETKKKDS